MRDHKGQVPSFDAEYARQQARVGSDVEAERADPTYNMDEIRANPEWHLAWVLSELRNDNAPIGWSKYCSDARQILWAGYRRDAQGDGRFPGEILVEEGGSWWPVDDPTAIPYSTVRYRLVDTPDA